MKKLLIALVVVMGLSANVSHAVPGLWIGSGTAVGSGSALSVLPGVAFGAVMIYAATTKPHYSLADSCKLKNVQKEGANYSSASYEHCK